MNLLILGSGAREHAFCYFIAKNPSVGQIYVAPGNGGTSSCAINVNVNPLDFESVWDFCIANDVSTIIPCNEDPLVNGIVDFIQHKNMTTGIDIIAIGPNTYASQLEGSKDFAKNFMDKNNIPTAKYKTFDENNVNLVESYLDEITPPYVLKADGLAAGKGVVITSDKQEALQLVNEMILNKMFGEASKKVVIENFLQGIEISVFAITDGVNYKILGSAKDYKQIFEGDKGPNTGGMGAISPVPFADSDFIQKVEDRILKPTLLGLENENNPFQGFLFLGLMNCNNEPYVIEYNVRMGDPETEAIFPRLKVDLLNLLLAIPEKKIDQIELFYDQRVAATVYLVSEGYPGEYPKGIPVSINTESNNDDIFLFHGGTKQIENNQIVTNGGRVLAVTCLANNLKDAIEKSQKTASLVDFQGVYFRKDIGNDLLTYTLNQ